MRSFVAKSFTVLLLLLIAIFSIVILEYFYHDYQHKHQVCYSDLKETASKNKLCTEEVFRLQNKVNEIQTVHTEGKDIVQMLIALNYVNQNIGKISDFSPQFIQIFKTIAKFRDLDQKFADFHNALYLNLYKLEDNPSLLIMLDKIEDTIKSNYIYNIKYLYDRMIRFMKKIKPFKNSVYLKSNNPNGDPLEKLEIVKNDILALEYSEALIMLDAINIDFIRANENFIALRKALTLIVDYQGFNKQVLQSIDSVY